ncbi:PREDICTED: uncharacterized protein LOC108661220 [Theobroma cacao]|uniref:Uncharacterized protein LOC108661220 n=1 Tax=Theobroma cacao TaxID=3641 RepID=A0AB32W0V1_THECC|nr:PREDICTED: uncharacterized protein LOC108661220 [Theobroma cacao]
MKKSQTVGEFVKDVMNLVNQIRLMSETLTNVKVVEKVMMSLPERFNATVTSLDQVKDISELTISELVSALETDEQRKAAMRDEKVDHALSAHAKGKPHVDSSFRKNPNDLKEKDKVERVCKNKADIADKKPKTTKQVEKVEVAKEVLFMAITESGSIDENHSCQLGKLTKKPFPKLRLNSIVNRPDLVHFDVVGPMSEPSLNGRRYFVIFIDDMSRMTWIYFMEHKSEVFSVFQKFKARVENESSCKIKTLRKDNRGGHISSEFTSYLENEGILHQLTAPYYMSEKKNRIVVDMSKCLLFQKMLLKSFCAEAASTAVYLQNILIT